MATKKPVQKTFASAKLSDLNRQFNFARQGLMHAQLSVGAIESAMWEEAYALGVPKEQGWLISWDAATQTSTATKTGSE